MVHYLCPHCEKQEPTDASHDPHHYTTVKDDAHFIAGTACSHCGRADMKCFHHGSKYDEQHQAFICGDCGEECGFTTLPLLGL